MRLRYFYCKRHIGFFQQLFRGLEKFIPELESGYWALGTCTELILSGAVGAASSRVGRWRSINYFSPIPLISLLPTPFISPYLIVELSGKLYLQLIKKAQSQLPLVAFL